MRRKLVITVEANDGVQEDQAWCAALFAMACRADEACRWRAHGGVHYRPLGEEGAVAAGLLAVASWRVEAEGEAGDVLARALARSEP